VKTLLKSVHIYQSYCKKNLAQFFLAHPVDRLISVIDLHVGGTERL